ncbi:MAG: hypothetical protein NTX52_04585 [Planctomycetota bacterium]|nr:hypothetical protein [Planctomycetota bacterium]
MFRYWLVLLIISMSAGYLFAAAGDEHTFELKWQQKGEGYSFSEPLDRNVPFDKEPQLGANGIFRGVLNYPGQTNDNAGVGFIWDKSEGRLYVDLNKDGDLTNDPNGILESERKQRADFQNFPAFPLSFSTRNGISRYQVKADMQGTEWFQQAGFTIRSGYSGQIDLYGGQWRFSVNDNFEGIVQKGSRLSVSPTGKDATNFISSLPSPESLFLEGQCYDMAFEFRKSDNDYPALWCKLTERTVPLATLRVEGRWISQLVLGDDDVLVLPPLTEGAFSVPAMPLSVKKCCLKYEKDKPEISPKANMPSVHLLENQEMVLRIGGPLGNSVDIKRAGKILKFNYELVGVGGEKYDVQQITNYDNNKKPSIAIYKGDMQLAGGKFEFG